ncbi:MAG: hypothetical protein D6691_08630 [Candidatus Hydrogenedentota bacterium]|nr:MAG: hypothetical protein D6691_08630 [Candidatus Hydrogenedentota bacterium]
MVLCSRRLSLGHQSFQPRLIVRFPAKFEKHCKTAQVPRFLGVMHRNPKVVSFFRLVLVLIASAIVWSGCKDKDLFVFRLDHSVNVFYPSPKWPDAKRLTPPEREVYERYGKPTAFRVLWTPSGQIRLRRELELAFDKKLKTIPPYTWVYVDKGKEIVFRGASYEEIPLSDQIRLVLKYGDPEDVRDLGAGTVEWMYFSVGKLYRLKNGRIVDTKDFPAMGKFIKD